MLVKIKIKMQKIVTWGISWNINIYKNGKSF
jgi:hypothetical protein